MGDPGLTPSRTEDLTPHTPFRALYFVLAGVMDRFHYLRAGLALVLAFVGAKMLLTSVYKIPISVSLGVIAVILACAAVASVFHSNDSAGERARWRRWGQGGEDEVMSSLRGSSPAPSRPKSLM
jgi:hypothetical protein